MGHYKNILVAVDLSDESGRILSKAVDLADSEATLSVAHVFEPLLSSYSYELNRSDYERVEEVQQKGVTQQLNDLLASSGLDLDKARIHILQGKAATELKRLSDETGVDLLVMGSHGHNPLRSILGSTANAVLHGISCDVLTVRV